VAQGCASQENPTDDDDRGPSSTLLEPDLLVARPYPLIISVTSSAVAVLPVLYVSCLHRYVLRAGVPSLSCDPIASPLQFVLKIAVYQPKLNC
jgi:hypothetical protein